MGSGVFVLTGLIAREVGPLAPFCFLLGGIGCIFSAASYAELSCRIPSTGSGYTYVFATLGELPAFLAASCLTLEYGVAAAAVAISWGDKMSIWLENAYGVSERQTQPLNLNVAAAVLQLVCVLLLLRGIDISKRVVNVLTVAKLLLCALMILCGLSLFETKLFAPSEMKTVKLGSVLSGATASFFSFLGYDEVCFLSSESRHPGNMPKAVFATLIISTVVYLFASVALVGMRERLFISQDNGFTEAFSAHGGSWVGFSRFVAVGELCTLPLVVLVSFMAQPRLQLAMAQDGLLPNVFAQLDGRGNMTNGILISGALCVLLALMVPFEALEDVISAGVLLSFQLTNAALLVLRKHGSVDDTSSSAGQAGPGASAVFNELQQNSAHDPDTPSSDSDFEHDASSSSSSSQPSPSSSFSLSPLAIALLAFHGAAVVFAVCISVAASAADERASVASAFAVLSGLVCVWLAKRIANMPSVQSAAEPAAFEVPFVPWTPLIGSAINWVLLVQLKPGAATFIAVFLVSATVLYLGTRARSYWWRGSCWASAEQAFESFDRLLDPPSSSSPSLADGQDVGDRPVSASAPAAAAYKPLELEQRRL